MAAGLMQRLLPRLVPRSLFWRVLLIIAGGLLLLQVISFQVSVRERDRVIDLSADRFLLDRTVQLVEVIDALPADQRARVLQLFSRGPFRAELPEAGKVPDAAADDARAEAYGRNLRQRLGAAHEVRILVKVVPFEPVVLPFKADSGFAAPRALGREAVPRAPSDRAGAGPGLAPAPGSTSGPGARPPPGERGEVVETHIRLRDGEWLTLSFGLKRKRMPLPAPSYETWALTLGGMLVIALAGAVAVIWPLRQFARRVDAYAGNLSLPPMPESGPNEVVSATRALNRLHERLAMLLRNRTDMLTAMSHDLKTPVTRLRLRAETLEEGPVKEKINSDLDEMESLIGATLDYFRAGTAADVQARVRPAEFIRAMLADSPHWTGRVSVEGSADLALNTSPIMLRRVVNNLVDNALNYGGDARVEVVAGDAEVTIRITDQGPGIPQAELERVFEPFYRVEGSRNRDTGGSGLGLAIARELARGADGDVRLTNLFPGLEARLTLPRR